MARLTAIVVLGFFAWPRPLLAQLGVPDRAYDEGRLAAAQEGYAQALAAGRLDPAGLVRAHVRLGVLAALAGDEAALERHFEIALALDPTRDAPDELSPELRARFEALRGARDGRRLRASIEERDGALFVTIHDAPEQLVATVAARGAAGFRERLAWEGSPLRLDPPVEARPIEVVVLDEHGNRLARAGARLELTAAPEVTRLLDTEPSAEPEPTGHSIIETPWLWIAVGVVVLGIGVTVGVSASGERYLLDPPVVR